MFEVAFNKFNLGILTLLNHNAALSTPKTSTKLKKNTYYLVNILTYR
jgi:hypothetical protein